MRGNLVAVLTISYDTGARKVDVRTDAGDHLRFDLSAERVNKLFESVYELAERQQNVRA